VASSGGKLLVAGGRTPTDTASAEEFDPATGRWSTIASMSSPRGGIAGAATANGLVVIVGGEAQTVFDKVEGYDVKAGRWSLLPPMLTARHGLGVVSIGNKIYTVAGGHTPGYAFTDANEVLDLS
ncbi:MAG TPA: hypothetical protein VI541_04920, partial [Actinomycetota bacterium]|nr:hypothetical protein [Actinomycetota bacterium]